MILANLLTNLKIVVNEHDINETLVVHKLICYMVMTFPEIDENKYPFNIKIHINAGDPGYTKTTYSIFINTPLEDEFLNKYPEYAV